MCDFGMLSLLSVNFVNSPTFGAIAMNISAVLIMQGNNDLGILYSMLVS